MSGDSQVDLKVIGVGLSRTGTLSMRSALERLVGPTYHGSIPVAERKEHQAFWMKCVQNGELDIENYHEVLAEYKAGVDVPFIIWWKDLVRLHPKAKVILTVRDPVQWRQSWNGSIKKYLEMATSWPGSWTHTLLGEWRTVDFMVNMEKTCKVDSLNMSMETAFLSDENAIEFFTAHTEEVKSMVPQDNLLVFNVKEGWGPLCEFLQLPEPDIPFPRVNDRSQILYLVKVGVALSWFLFLVLPVIVAVLGYYFIQDASQLMLVLGGTFLALLSSRAIFDRVTRNQAGRKA